ncbi:hypothetical protein ABZ467_05880 [Streptomyces sp. NPDC005727]|uniref:hypothetical protein n=1 Tax=Streptomyces sp. NPDC005727 TaxID=3157053 RepID=UPI0033DBC4C1
MSWEEEWAQLKADALARRQSAHMQLNQLPGDGGGGPTDGPAGHGAGFSVSADSIDGSSHELLEIAGVLYEGRMDGENATTCRAPRAHPELAASVETFARYAKEQYADAVILLAALAGKLKSAGGAYANYDEAVRGELNSVLTAGCYTAPADR